MLQIICVLHDFSIKR